MENELKFYLLAEQSGWDCSAYAYQYRKKIKEDTVYQLLSYNVVEAKKHISSKAIFVCEEFDKLNLDPVTLKDVFLLETKINYLTLHSFPEYYINPLTVDPSYLGSVTSIGDLMIEINNRNMSINELIFDEEIPIEEKKDCVKETINEYLIDANGLINKSIQGMRHSAFGKNTSKQKNDIFRFFIEITNLLICNVFLYITFFVPFDKYWNCFYHPQYDKAMSYLSYIFPLTLFLFDLFFAIYHSYRAKISEPYNYARRFLKKHSSVVYNDIEQTSHRLTDYVIGAINLKIELKNDLKNFSKLSTSYIDLKKVLSVDSLKKKTSYIVLRSLSNTFATICFITFVVTFIIYLFGIIQNIAI